MAGTRLFPAGPYRAFEMAEADIPRLQAFYAANPEYHLLIGGQPPAPDEAHQEFHARPPAEFSFRKKWILGFEDGSGALVAIAEVVADLFAQDVWHIGLFIVATVSHGCGAAQALHRHLEAWMVSGGARWLRLGVVAGNTRAERFGSAWATSRCARGRAQPWDGASTRCA